MKNSTFFLAASLFALVACNNPQPKMLSFTPSSVVIDYTGNDLRAATNIAQQFCASVDKVAQYVDKKSEFGYYSGSKQIAFFNCKNQL